MKKGNDKKKTSKEEEAALLQEKQRLIRAQEIENNLKYGIYDLIKDKSYPMILTQWFIQEAWTHDTPRAFTKEYLTTQFGKLGILNSVTDDELELYSNTILRNLIFG